MWYNNPSDQDFYFTLGLVDEDWSIGIQRLDVIFISFITSQGKFDSANVV